MESAEIRIRQRYFRKTKANPEGTVAHHGDCDFFNIRLCTCALLHDLRPVEPERARDLYPTVAEELAEHDKAREAMMHGRNHRKH